MNRHAIVRLSASFMLLLTVLVMGLGSVSKAYAQDKGTGSAALPQYKQPNSARFDIAGSVRSSDLDGQEQVITISGFGAFSGNDFEETLTYAMPADLQVQGQPSSFTLEVKVVQGKYYMKLGGLLGGPEDQWYVMDAPATANNSILLDLSALGSDFTVTEQGKETLNGAPTTKYKVDIDVSKLLGDSGEGFTSQPGNSFTMAVYLWIGDMDQYLHKYSIVLDLKSTVELDEQTKFEINIAIDMSLTLKDFDTPITITAPENAVPLDSDLAGSTQAGAGISGLGGLVGVLGTMSSPAGMPVGMPVGMPGIALPGTSPDMGMPKTGADDQQSSLAWGLIALALGMLSVGTAIRLTRKSTVKI